VEISLYKEILIHQDYIANSGDQENGTRNDWRIRKRQIHRKLRSRNTKYSCDHAKAFIDAVKEYNKYLKLRRTIY
jgi:hypothetical protein